MANRKMNGSKILIKAMLENDSDVVFGYPGGAVLPIYDELFKQNRLRHILVRQEGGAVHSAEGYARSTGKVGAVLVTSGPGATNTITGLADAMMDSIPLVCFTGQVPTSLIGNDAFQEADITGISRSCTKHNYLVTDVNDLAATIHEAFYIARSGRPGPVVVDLPKDVLQADGLYTAKPTRGHRTYRPKTKASAASIDKAVAMIAAAKRPLLYCGGGVINAGPKGSNLLAEFAQMTGLPVTLTLMGLGAYPASDKQFLGMVGMHGTLEANLAMHECDLMINIGARFDDRVTGSLPEFSPGSDKIHVDIDPSSINKTVVVDLPIIGDAASVLKDMIGAWKAGKLKTRAADMKKWWARIEKWRARDCLSYKNSDTLIKPQYALECLWDQIKDRDAFVSTEVGQHQMWAAQFLHFDKPNHWMTSGGLGTMGYGLPAAIGVQVAHPDATVIDVSGESSLMMNIQEMSTAAQYRLPVKVFVLNNHYMGMVRQWQELLYGGRYSESYAASLPDFAKLAEAYGWTGLRATKPGEVKDVVKTMLETDGPVLVDIHVDPAENCFPMIPAGAAHNEILLGPDDQADMAPTEDSMSLA